MQQNIVTILCSGVAMGVYIPGLAARHQLDSYNIPSEVVVLESLFRDEKRNKLNDTKKVFHQNFRVAQKAHEMAKDITPNLDPELLGALLRQWRLEGRRLFMVFSGFWMPILMKYREFVQPQEIYADLVHVDSTVSPSWKTYREDYLAHFDLIKLFDSEHNCLGPRLFTPKEPGLGFSKREERLVIHGGGWGMGLFQSRIPEINERGIGLNIVVYFKEADLQLDPGNRYFMVNPAWRAWNKAQDGRVEFPPFGELTDANEVVYANRAEYHELFYVIAQSKGIISKPGGSTLVDSLAAATPLVFLEALSEHEAKNAQLWINLGFGITYDEWKKSGFSFEILEKLHQNLLKGRVSNNDYVTSYLRKMAQIVNHHEQGVS
jgi:hypothetical protein